jgi:hypothetical protein
MANILIHLPTYNVPINIISLPITNPFITFLTLNLPTYYLINCQPQPIYNLLTYYQLHTSLSPTWLQLTHLLNNNPNLPTYSLPSYYLPTYLPTYLLIINLQATYNLVVTYLLITYLPITLPFYLFIAFLHIYLLPTCYQPTTS